MKNNDQIQVLRDTAETLRCVAATGKDGPAGPGHRAVLNTILQQARTLAWAEAGSLYILEKGQLQFLAAQNDRLPLTQITQLLLDRQMPASAESLAGFVASSGRIMKIDDAETLADDAPFRINRDLDADTGYRAKSILAIPLTCPDGRVIGVLELFNRLGPEGTVIPFPSADDPGVLSLAAMAAVAIHNTLLQNQLKQVYLDTILRLSVVVELRDNETPEHIHRISHTSALLARTMNLTEQEVDLFQCASPMHDIGKLVIPDAILHKPSRLTPEERKVVEQHPLMGAEILGKTRNSALVRTGHDIALSHHERWDGRGYPHRLKGDQIPLCGRIVGLADVLDALLSNRCYKKAFSPAVAAETIRLERGKHFDPDVADAFSSIADTILASYVAEPTTPLSVPAN